MQVAEVAIDQHITDERALPMVSQEAVDHPRKFGAVLAKRPSYLTSASNGDVGMDLDMVEDLLPELCFVAVHDDHGNQTGIDHLQQILVLENFIGYNQIHFRLAGLLERLVQLHQALEVAARAAHVNLFTG